MNYYALIKLLYPSIKDHEFELGHNDETEVQINKWLFSEQQPTVEYLQSFRDKMATFAEIENAAILGQRYLDETDYRAIRVNEGYELSQEIKDAREAARASVRALRDFKLN